MFAVDHILVSESVLQASFACQLQVCQGACCVQGESGAPLEPGERFVLEALVPALRPALRPEAQRLIDERGPWEKVGADRYAVRCTADGACVFAVYDPAGIVRCAIQQAYVQGHIDFPKPISCHLYPLRVERRHGLEILHYEKIPLCDAARAHGTRCGIALIDFLEAPLVRRYGRAWYDRLRTLWMERCQSGLAPQSDGKEPC